MSDESKVSRPGQQDEEVEAHSAKFGVNDEAKAGSKPTVTDDESDEVEAHGRKFTGPDNAKQL